MESGGGTGGNRGRRGPYGVARIFPLFFKAFDAAENGFRGAVLVFNVADGAFR